MLFTEAKQANRNTGDTFGYEKLYESKMRYLSLALRQKFSSPSFESQWEAMGDINSKEGKRRTVIKRLKTLTSNFIVRLTLDIVDSYYGTECCSLQFFCERESKITLLKLFKGEHNFHNFLNIIRQSNDRLTKLYSEFDYVRLSLAMELLLFE